MSRRTQNSGNSSSQQQYTTSSRYRNSNASDSRTGFGGSAQLNKENQPKNIMHDRRVIRGSTCSLRKSIENRLNDMSSQSNNTSKRSTTRRRIKNRKNDYNKNKNIKTPRPVTGRLHAEMQTDPYLEEIYVTKKEKEFGTQTDPLLDIPSTPLFIPKLSGPSIATQIEDGDLFDFDHEIEPILEVLIGKTIENSLMEVLEEEELKSYKKYKLEFEQKRNIQVAKCQRLEEEQRRANEEKERRIKQVEIQKEKEILLKKRIDAQRIATEFLENIENIVFEELDKKGYFFDPVVKEIETIFMPQLLKNVESKIDNVKISNMIVDDIIANFVENMIHNSKEIINKRDEEQKEFERKEMLKIELNNKFIEKRKEFTQAIKSQQNDYDFKEQIIQFLNIPICVSKKEQEQVDDDDKKEDVEEEETEELPSEIQQNIEYIDGLMEQFTNEEEPLWKQLSSMLDKIGGEISDKIERMDKYLQTFSIKLYKKQLLDTFTIYKEDEENLKKAIVDCLGIDTFDDESHSKVLELLQSEEQKEQMNAINELVKDKENIKQFVETFTQQKEEERNALQEAAKAAESEENEEES